MPDKIQVNEDLGIIEVESFGNVSRDDISQSIAKVRELFVEKGLSKILVDTRKQDEVPDTMDIFELFSTFPRELRIALLVEQSQSTKDDLDLAETVGVNRGVHVRILDEKESALQWLNG
jgi:hypothetical protein